MVLQRLPLRVKVILLLSFLLIVHTANAVASEVDKSIQQIQSSHRLFAQNKPESKQVSLINAADTLLINNTDEQIWLISTNQMQVIDDISIAKKNIIQSLISHQGRYIYLASQSGWIYQYDRLKKAIVAEVKVGKDSRTMALSHDGRYLAVGNYQPRTLVILNAKDLSPLKVIQVNDGFGLRSRVNVIHTNAIRETFAVALEDIPQAWEVSYADDPPPGFSGWEHSYQPETGDLVKSKPFPVRRLMLKGNLKNFRFGSDFISLIGNNGKGLSQVIDSDIRRVLFKIDSLKQANLSTAAIWNYKNKPVLVSSQKSASGFQVIDSENGQLIKNIPTQMPGSFVRSHPKENYSFAAIPKPADKSTQLLVINKDDLSIIKTIPSESGKTINDVLFSTDGNFITLNITINKKDKAAVKKITFLNSKTLQEVKTLVLTQ